MTYGKPSYSPLNYGTILNLTITLNATVGVLYDAQIKYFFYDNISIILWYKYFKYFNLLLAHSDQCLTVYVQLRNNMQPK